MFQDHKANTKVEGQLGNPCTPEPQAFSRSLDYNKSLPPLRIRDTLLAITYKYIKRMRNQIEQRDYVIVHYHLLFNIQIQVNKIQKIII